jgi:hypothetical protein
MTHHLTHEQLCDVLLASSAHIPEQESFAVEAAEDHLRNCLLCSAELQNLRASLSLFRHATHSYAEAVYARPAINKASIAPSPRTMSHVRYWAIAALLLVAVLLPLSLHRHRTSANPQPAVAIIVSPQTTESDEALLEGIAQDLSTSVPSPMQPLANPTAELAMAQSTPDQSTSTQRKN